MSEYLKPLGNRIYAGGLQTAGALYFNYAHTASPYLAYILKVAKRRNINAGLSGCFQNGIFFGNGYIPVIYFKSYHYLSSLICVLP